MRVFIKLLLAITIASALGLYLLFSALRTPIRMPLKGDPDHYSERVSLPETSILNGCIENFGKGACQGRMSLLLNGKIRRNPSEFLADGVGSNIPNPRWNGIASKFRFWGAEHCGPEQISLFLSWFNKSKPGDGLISVSLLPDNLGLCFGRETQNGEVQYRYFWFFRVIDLLRG